MKKPLSESTLKELGFVAPFEPTLQGWWEHRKDNIQFTTRPTADELLKKIRTEAYSEGVNDTQNAVKDALGIHS